MRFFLLSLIVFQLGYSYTGSDSHFQSRAVYTDPELENVWNAVSDVTNPTLEDYRLIESYFQNGDRPYLKTLSDTSLLYHHKWDDIQKRIEQARNFKVIGPNGEMPIYEFHEMRVTEKTKDRCILLYSSYNASYPEKLRHIFEELKKCGYSGNVMIRIGGYPNLSEGGLKSCPFYGSWKIEFFKEALRMGFKKILQIDTTIHPLNDLTTVFEAMNEKGHYLLYSGYTLPYFAHHQYLYYLNFTPSETSQVPWILNSIIGFNFSDQRVERLFHGWDQATKNINQFYYLDMDGLILTTVARKHGIRPIDFSSNRIISGEAPLPHLLPKSIEFYSDEVNQ